ncbi:MAG: hypothetical protein NVS9B10_22060 [Nevskia sp.]
MVSGRQAERIVGLAARHGKDRGGRGFSHAGNAAQKTAPDMAAQGRIRPGWRGLARREARRMVDLARRDALYRASEMAFC